MIYGCPIWLFFQFRNQKYVVHACEGKEFKIICKQFICKDLSGFLVRTLKQREHFVAGFIGIQFFITVYSMELRIVDFSREWSKLEIFILKISCSQMKLPNLNNCSIGKLSKSAKIWLSKLIFHVKNHPNPFDFFHGRIWN